MKNLKTTSFGLLSILVAGWNIYTTKNVSAGDMAAISAGIGLITAKDGDPAPVGGVRG